MSSPSELPLETSLSEARNPDTEEEDEDDEEVSSGCSGCSAIDSATSDVMAGYITAV